MNAMAVPPSGWKPFEAPEGTPVRGTSRRNVGQGLAISALVHLGALACILWIQAQRAGEEIVLINRPIDLVPPIADPFIPPPVVDTPPDVRPKGGRIVPSDFVDKLVTEQPKFEPAGGIQQGEGVKPGNEPSPTGHGSNEVSAVVNPDPPEDAFIAVDEPPVPIYHPDPAYPEWARENGIDGRVVLHALVGVDGRVRKVTVIRGIPGLSESAEETLYRWTFKPARAGRQPVAVWIEVPFSFRL